MRNFVIALFKRVSFVAVILLLALAVGGGSSTFAAEHAKKASGKTTVKKVMKKEVKTAVKKVKKVKKVIKKAVMEKVAPASAPTPTPTPAPTNAPSETMQKEAPAMQALEVLYQNHSFTPAALKIKVGEKVTFTNKHVAAIRLASNPHPIHTSRSDFDSDTLDPGASYTFTFSQAGTLNYHNHFNPSVAGQIIIE